MGPVGSQVVGIVQLVELAQPPGPSDPEGPLNPHLQVAASSHAGVPEACQGLYVTDEGSAVFGGLLKTLGMCQKVFSVAAAEKVFSSLVKTLLKPGRCLAKAVELLLLGFGHAVGLLGLAAATCVAVLVAGLGAELSRENPVISLVQSLKGPAFVFVSEGGVGLSAVASLALVHQSHIGASNQAVLVAAATNGQVVIEEGCHGVVD